MTAEAFAFIGFETERVIDFALKLLAVGGGFLVGHVLTGVVAWALDRWITGGKTPQGVHRVSRTIGGVAVAILVAMALFGRGGYGDGDGGGPDPDGKGSGQTLPTQREIVTLPPTVSQKDVPPPEQRVRVTLLGGANVQDEKFYLIADDQSPKVFADVIAAVNTRKAETKKPVGIELRFTVENTLAESHAAVQRVISWARSNDVTVTLPATKP